MGMKPSYEKLIGQMLAAEYFVFPLRDRVLSLRAVYYRGSIK